MYSSGPHRVNVIAAPEPAHEPSRAQADTPEMRRLAALFNAHRDAVCRADEQGAEQQAAAADTADAAATGQEQADAPTAQPDPAAAAAQPDAAAEAAAAAQREASLAGLPFAPVWQKPDQNGGGSSGNSGDSASGGNSGNGESGNASSQGGPGGNGSNSRDLGHPGNAGGPAAAPRRAAAPASMATAAPATLLAALRAAGTAPAFTASRPAAIAPPAAQPAPSGAEAQPRHARVAAAPAALGIGALKHGAQQNPLIDSIVSSVADFCANPAVFSSSPWQLTVPLDPALLPGSQLTLVLSHFALTLRFATTEPASHDLILQHADALRESLEALPTLHQDTPRAIEIVVT